MERPKIKFGSNGKLKILQVSDAQDMQIVRRSMIRMLNTAYDLIKPDIVLFTGDNILGNHLNDAIVGTRKVVKTPQGTFKRIERSLGHILQPLQKRGIPFAMVFGNHDDMNCFTQREQIEIYKRYSCCVAMNESNPDVECDTYNIPVYSANAESVAYNIWMLNSAGHNGEQKYEYVSKQTVDWYIRKSNELKAQNDGEPVMSLMFQHIPIPEARELFIECDESEGTCQSRENGKFYKLNPKLARGLAQEYPNVCSENHGQFDAAVKQGDVSAIVAGHDHKNCFIGKLRGVDIVQTPCASFRCYGNSKRGVRLFVVDENDVSNYKTKNISYFDIFGKKPLNTLRYVFDADDMVRVKYTILSVTAAAAASAAVFAKLTTDKKKRLDEKK